MPAVSERQRKAMCAAAGGNSTLGISRSVGREFCGAKDAPPRYADRRWDAGPPAKDMSRLDWRGLIYGLVKFFREEMAEPAHVARDDQPVLATTPNSAPPSTRRVPGKKAVEDDDPAPPRAASVLIIDPAGRVLLVKRAATEENWPDTWAFPGGKVDPGETPEEAARRETLEEVGYDPAGPLTELETKRTPYGLDHTTYLHRVSNSFEPRLNGEHSESSWFPWQKWPAPLHPGVAATLEGLPEDAADLLTNEDEIGEDAEFEETKHPRDHGKFSTSEGGSSSKEDLSASERAMKITTIPLSNGITLKNNTQQKFAEESIEFSFNDSDGEKIGNYDLYYYPGIGYTTHEINVNGQRGQGLGRQAVKALSEHLGVVSSDPQGVTSDAAVRMWESLGAAKIPTDKNSNGFFYQLKKNKAAQDIDLKRNPDGSLQPTVDLGEILPRTTRELRRTGTPLGGHPGPRYNGGEAADAEFEEGKHPRDHGKFSTSAGGGKLANTDISLSEYPIDEILRDPEMNYPGSARKVVKVPVSKLEATQASINEPHLNEVTGSKEPIEVVKIQGHYLIHDGHHRVVLASRRGDDFIEARILDLDIPENRRFLSKSWREENNSVKLTAIDMALDRASVRAKDQDGRLHVEVSNISKAAVNEYLGHEIPDWEKLRLDPNRRYKLFRDPTEIAKAVGTFNNLPLLSRHVPVSAVNYQPDLVIGSTGTDAEFVAPFLRNSLVIWAKPAIDAIESGESRELSSAYRYVAVPESGTYDGQPYEMRMTQIIGNHVALVRNGRAGNDVAVGDSLRVQDCEWVALERALLQLEEAA